ncbi:MAG: hypothetical protein V4685_05060 [Bacteroidota bacterium]
MIPVNISGKILAIAISFATVCLFFSCKKTDNVSNVIEQPVDFSKKVISSVSGFVTNEYNAAVAGANIKYGESISTTNQYGYFEIKNALVVENAAAVIVKIPGYFNGIKTFVAKTGKSNFCRIKLISKTNTGSVDASSGGSVGLSNGLSVIIPASGVIDAVTKTAYSGTVNVSSYWIDPTASDLDKIMPGDLRGIKENGSLKTLTTFGMAVVELTGNAGQLLQISEGKKAVLNFPLPTAVAANAPTTIPLWYFDEAKGLWIEEGVATKSGNTYIGEVKHFTTWNCDLPNSIIPLSFSLTDSLSNPLSNVHVEITPLTTNSWSHIGGYTDETGIVNVNVTPNAEYLLQIFSNNCSVALPFSKIFKVEQNAVDLGRIAIGGGFAATITGTATNCNNNPLVNGRIMIRNGSHFEITYTNNEGTFTYSTLMCNSTNQTDFIAEDLLSAQQSQSVIRTISTGLNNIGNLQACGVSTEEYSNLTINGQNYSLGAYPNGTFMSSGSITTSGMDNPRWLTGYTATLLKMINGQYVQNGDHIQWGMYSTENPPALGNVSNTVVYFNLYVGDHVTVITTRPLNNSPVPVNITEFGPSGGYITGSINGLLYKELGWPNFDTANPYHIVYNFRVKNY